MGRWVVTVRLENKRKGYILTPDDKIVIIRGLSEIKPEPINCTIEEGNPFLAIFKIEADDKFQGYKKAEDIIKQIQSNKNIIDKCILNDFFVQDESKAIIN